MFRQAAEWFRHLSSRKNSKMKYYFRVKMLLLTFLLGLAAVFVFNDSLSLSGQKQFEAPQTQINQAVFVVPVEKENIRQENLGGGGASGGTTCDEARAEAKRLKRKFSHPNCD